MKLNNDYNLNLNLIETNLDFVELTSQGVGTYSYLAPECFSTDRHISITTKVDIWSIGIILYEMIFNKKPFLNGINFHKNIFNKNLNAENYIVEYPVDINISDDCKDFINNCLKFNVNERYDINQAFNNKFIQNIDLHN